MRVGLVQCNMGNANGGEPVEKNRMRRGIKGFLPADFHLMRFVLYMFGSAHSDTSVTATQSINHSVCINLTANWFWTGATIPLSLQSNLAGSPAGVDPVKPGALLFSARR